MEIDFQIEKFSLENKSFNTTTTSTTNSSNSTSTSNETLLLSDTSEPSPNCDFLVVEYVTLIVCIVGIFGNTLAGVTIRLTQRSARPRCHKKRYPHSLAILSALDSVVLVFGMLFAIDRIIRITRDVEFIDGKVGHFGCMVIRFFPPLFRILSHWHVLAIAANRFVGIYFWHRFHLSSKRKRRIFILLCIIAVLSQSWRLALDSKSMYKSSGINATDDIVYWSCGPPQEMILSYITFDLFFHRILLLFVIPVVGVVVMNCAIVFKLYETHRSMEKLGGRKVRGGSPITERHWSTATTVTSVRNSSISTAHSTVTMPPAASAAAAALSCSCSSAGPGYEKRSTTSNYSARSSSVSGKRFSDAAEHWKVRTNSKGFLKTSILLLTVTCCFVLCIIPELVFLLYIVVKHLLFGNEAAAFLFYKYCKIAKFTELITTFGYAHNLIVFTVVWRDFRRQLILIFLRIFSLCSKKMKSQYKQRKSKVNYQKYIPATKSTSIVSRAARNTSICRYTRGSTATTTAINEEVANDDDGKSCSVDGVSMSVIAIDNNLPNESNKPTDNESMALLSNPDSVVEHNRGQKVMSQLSEDMKTIL